MASPLFIPDPALYPDPTGRADRICRFIAKLTLWEGDRAGQRFPVAPYQEAMIRRIYGPTNDQGERLVRIAAVWIPRGNAKTTLASGLALAHFMGPETEAGGQVVMAAADRENAGIAFNCSHQFITQAPSLAKRVRAIESRKALIHPSSKSTLKAVSTEAYSKHGLNISTLIADEIHAWAPAQARPFFKVLTDSMIKRSAPLVIIISTAGEGAGGLAHDLWTYSHKVARGEVEDPTFAPIIFAADPSADWRDEAAWSAANPAIEAGFLSLDDLRVKARRIAHFPAEVADFRRFHLNQWQEGAAEPWIALELFDGQDAMTPAEALTGRAAWVGVDLSSVEDLAAVVAVFPDGEGEARAYDVLPQFFLPEAGLARKSEEDRADYLRWADEGLLTLTPGNVIDHAAIIAHVEALGERHGVQEVAIDRWNSTAVNTALQASGFTVAQFGQGFASMAAPVKELKRAILSRAFRHGGNPLLRMCFANVVAEKDAAENEKFTKARARGRIDGAVAAAMAVGRIIAAENAPSPYETERPEGFLFI